MNIKKSSLMAGLLTLNAVFGAMTGKAEAPKYMITEADKEAMLFNQEEVSSFQINGVDVRVMKGWSHEQKWFEQDEQGNDVLMSRTLTAPFIVGREGSGFTGAFDDVPSIGTVAVNEDNGKAYAFGSGTTNDFYEISFGTNNVTSTEPLKILTQLKPKVTATLGFYSANTNTSNKVDLKVDHAIAWTDKDNGEFILTYNKEGGQRSTAIWHRNGVVNKRAQFAGVEPVEVLKGDNVIYYTDGAKMASISKTNPEAGETAVELVEGNVGSGVIGDKLYQATDSKIYNGKEAQLYAPTENNGITTYLEAGISGINGMTSDGSRLIVSYNADATVAVTELSLDKTVPVIAVQGATKVAAKKDGIYAMIKNQMVRVHE